MISCLNVTPFTIFFLYLYFLAIPVFNVCFKYFLLSCWAQLSWGECPPLTSSLKLGPLCCVPYVCMIILPYPFFPYATWSHFFYYGKRQNGKIYQFTNLKATWSGKFYRPNSIETALRTDEYQSVFKWFRMSSQIYKWKSFAVSTFAIIEEMASAHNSLRVYAQWDILINYSSTR